MHAACKAGLFTAKYLAADYQTAGYLTSDYLTALYLTEETVSETIIGNSTSNFAEVAVHIICWVVREPWSLL